VKRYGDRAAINDISFDVKTGEILGFLGPNGAGKTTTMKIITCYMPPTSGTVDVDGMDVREHSLEVRKKIGYLPEMNPLYFDMNALDSLEFAAELHGLRGNAMQQRVKEAMIHDPDVLILDEPTSGLDPNQIVEIRTLIKELGRAKTVVLSTHILSEVQATCDRVLIINDGIIVANGTPEQLQRTFQGAEEISLELKTSSLRPIEEIMPKLKLVAYVKDVALLSHTGDVSKFEIHAEKGNDVREALFRMAVSEGWIILEMQRRITSLEEVFHTLTTT
jgi:ABC-2 type transport system ATP-binding protein